MIAYIKGTVHSYGLDWLILDTPSIGYRVYFAHPEKIKLNQEILLYTYHYIREDEQSLYGFLTSEDYDLFVRIISVKGVGCKTANNILAASTTERLIQAIESSDVNYLKQMPGIGAKTAQQMILDLKGKLVSASISKQGLSRNIEDTLEALKSLGYKSSELNFLEKALEDLQDQSSDILLKTALKLLNQRKGSQRG